jgi:hypothetical protein
VLSGAGTREALVADADVLLDSIGDLLPSLAGALPSVA